MGSLGFPNETLLRFVGLVKTGGVKAKPHFEVKLNESEIPRGGNIFLQHLDHSAKIVESLFLSFFFLLIFIHVYVYLSLEVELNIFRLCDVF